MAAPEDSNPNETPFSDSEDSNVFNYMSELSPLKPDKPVHHSQSLYSTTTWSPPPVFTSPHVSYSKEPRFLQSHSTPFLDAPKPNVSLKRGLQISSGEAPVSYTSHAHHDCQIAVSRRGSEKTMEVITSSELPGNTDQGNALVKQLSRKCALGMPQDSMYDCGRPGYDGRGLFAPVSEIEGPRCDWESLNPNGTDALEGLMQKPFDPTIRPGNFMPQLPQNTFRNLHIVDSQQEIRYGTSNPKAATETEQMQNNSFNLAAMARNLNERMNDELRRFLGYDMAGMQRKNSACVSNNTPRTSQFSRSNVPNDKRLVPTTANINSNSCIMPRTTLKDSMVMNKRWSSTRQPSQSSSASLHLSASQRLHQTSSMRYSQSSPLIIREGLNQKGSNRKRRKLDHARDEGCKCKITKCLKLYCECFASGVYCTETCSCLGCSNKPIYKYTVLETRKIIEARDPFAFAPKVIRNAHSSPEIGVEPNKTPASTRHRRGCNCKKSGCEKKYCECFQNGVGCSILCRCGGCKNTYGRNYGSSELRIETEAQRNESCEMLMAEKVSLSQITETLNNEGHPNSAAPSPIPSLPFRSSSAPVSSVSRRRRPSNLFIPAASGFHANQRLNENNILHSQPTFECNFQSNNEMETPNIHQVGDGSSITSNNSSYGVSEIFLHPDSPYPSPNSHQ